MSKKRGSYLQSKKFHCKFTQVNAYLRIFAKKSAMKFPKKGRGGGAKGRLEFFQKTSILANPYTPKSRDNELYVIRICMNIFVYLIMFYFLIIAPPRDCLPNPNSTQPSVRHKCGSKNAKVVRITCYFSYGCQNMC